MCITLFGLTYLRNFISFRIFVTSSFRNCHKVFHITTNLVLTLWCHFPAKKIEIWKTKSISIFQNDKFYMQNFRYWYQKWKKKNEWRWAVLGHFVPTLFDHLWPKWLKTPLFWDHTIHIAHKRDSPLGVWPSLVCVYVCVWSRERGCRTGSFVRSISCTMIYQQ